jgi:thioredoxin
MVKEVYSNSFQGSVIEVSKQKPVLVDFWATWCGSCQAMLPMLEKLEHDLGDSGAIIKVNMDNNIDIAKEFNVKSLPTFLLFKDEKVVSVLTGTQTYSNLLKLFK